MFGEVLHIRDGIYTLVWGEYHVRTTMVSGFKLGIKTMLSASELHSVYTCNAQKTYHNNVHVDVHLERTINNTTTKLYNELK